MSCFPQSSFVVYHLDISLQAGLVAVLSAKCDGELSRFFLIRNMNNYAIFVLMFAPISKRFLMYRFSVKSELDLHIHVLVQTKQLLM